MTRATVRCFVAVQLPGEVVAGLERVTAQLARHGAAIRWIPAANLHLTMKFLGDVERTAVDDVIAALRGVPFEPLALQLESLGCFPKGGPPRILWAGLGGDVTALGALAQGFETALQPLGFERERRPFTAHVTLGRVKGPRAVNAVVAEMKKIEVTSAPFAVDAFVLMRSSLHTDGAQHEVIARF